MKLYLDDDYADRLLIRLLRQTGHDVLSPSDAGTSGLDDPIHFLYAIQEDRPLLTGNHDDFLQLHNLVVQAGGRHPGILVVRKDNDPKRDLTQRGIVQAIANLAQGGVPLQDGFHILNHWR